MRAFEFLNEDLSRRGFLGALGAGALAASGVQAKSKTAKQYAPSNIETTNISMNTNAEDLVQRTAIKAGIKGRELAQFMAQMKHESWDFERMKEKAQPGVKGYFAKRYDPKYAPKTAKILGNKHVLFLSINTRNQRGNNSSAILLWGMSKIADLPRVSKNS